MKYSAKNICVFGENIREKCEALNRRLPNGKIDGVRHNQQWIITQFELYGRPVSKNTVSDWFLGNKAPSFEHAVCLAHILGCSLDSLAAGYSVLNELDDPDQHLNASIKSTGNPVLSFFYNFYWTLHSRCKVSFMHASLTARINVQEGDLNMKRFNITANR